MSEQHRELKYERTGKPQLPSWWTDMAWPRLKDANYGEVAAKASIVAGRESPWRGDSITKFVQGTARTRELANGISRALGIPQPFFTARSEREARALQAVMETTEPLISSEQEAKLHALDQAAEAERRAAIDQTAPVHSADDKGRVAGRRTRRATRQRS